jgi:hypothetical protein
MERKERRMSHRRKGLSRRLSRGSIPQNGREAGVRFTKGHPKRAGRKKGTRNLVTRELKDAIIAAAEAVGSDGKGKGGLQGYCEFLARKDPKTYGMLLRAVMPLQLNATVRQPDVLKTREQLIAEMQSRGIPYQRFFPPQFETEDDPAEVANHGPVIDLKVMKS